MRPLFGHPLPPHVQRALTAATIAGALAGAITAPLSAQDGPRAARTLERGAIISAADITGDSVSPAAAALLGAVTRRVVREGELLRPPAVGRPPVVQAGALVRARVRTARIALVRDATVLADGAAGDTVPVRLDRATRVPAIVRDSATVELIPERAP